MTDTTRTEADGAQERQGEMFQAGKAAAQNRWLLVALGALTILAGVVALAMPLLASITATLLLGWVLIVAGAVGLVSAFRRTKKRQIAAAFALALVSIVAGVLTLVSPAAGMLALTTIIIGYFAAVGLVRLYYGVKSMGDGGGWMVAVGALSLVLAVLLWFGLPFNAAWVPGVLLGIDLILWGAVEISLGLREGRTPDTTDAARGA